jgi:hypothetical protein
MLRGSIWVVSVGWSKIDCADRCRGSSGERVPVDLGLRDVRGAFEPVTPVVGVRIPKRLGEGVGVGCWCVVDGG